MKQSNSIPSRPGPDQSRRRVLKGSAAATPLLWVVATRPGKVLAATECQAASAFGSLNASGNLSEQQVCSGRGPSYWAKPANFDQWPPPFRAAVDRGAALDRGVNRQLATQFHATGCSGHYFGGRTMVDVLEMAGQGGYAHLGAYIAASMLNAAAGLTPVLTVPQVVDMWNECTSNGFYEPTAGVRWSPEDIVTYLRTTISG